VRADGQALDKRRERRTRARESTKSISIKDSKRKSSGCALQDQGLTPGGLWWVRRKRACVGLSDEQWALTTPQESAEGIGGAARH
jgi:hypothetical protein